MDRSLAWRSISIAAWAARMLLVLLALGTMGVGGATTALAQVSAAKAAAIVEDYQFKNCLKERFPDIDRAISDHTRAFDSKSGRNFAYEDGKWIDVKTGEAICLKIPAAKAAAIVEDYQFKSCLKERFPDIDREIGDHTRAFDSKSGRNFAYEDGKWIDVKTGEAICPKEPVRRAEPPSKSKTKRKITKKHTTDEPAEHAGGVQFNIMIGGGGRRHSDEDREREQRGGVSPALGGFGR